MSRRPNDSLDELRHVLRESLDRHAKWAKGMEDELSQRLQKAERDALATFQSRLDEKHRALEKQLQKLASEVADARQSYERTLQILESGDPQRRGARTLSEQLDETNRLLREVRHRLPKNRGGDSFAGVMPEPLVSLNKNRKPGDDDAKFLHSWYSGGCFSMGLAIGVVLLVLVVGWIVVDCSSKSQEPADATMLQVPPPSTTADLASPDELEMLLRRGAETDQDDETELEQQPAELDESEAARDDSTESE